MLGGFLTFLAETFGENVCVLCTIYCYLGRKNVVFKKKLQFCRKFAKIANNDPNIDPWRV
jgi:hypothetical protein